MLNFDEKKLELVVDHYLNKIGGESLLELAQRGYVLQSREQAIELAKFYWDMLDESAKDKEDGVIVCQEADLQPIMERLFHAIGGYIVKCGYEPEWNMVCDEA